MPLLTLTGVSLAFGHHPLLDEVDLQVSAGDRVCLVGRNGAGKSTLFRVIAGTIEPDGGEVKRRRGLRVAHLEQETTPPDGDTVQQAVASGLGDLADGWNLGHQVLAVCSRLGLDPDARIGDCSGGTRRRAMLARTLVSAPDLLLLDEPTNHLDLEGIAWLEAFLASFRGALMLISHDRALLRRLSTSVVELDRGALARFDCDFDSYLRRKDVLGEVEQRAHARQDAELKEYEAWLRRGVRARRARNEGRVKKLQALRAAKARRLKAQGNVRMPPPVAGASGKRVLELNRVSFAYGAVRVVRDLSTSILRGDRVGVIGPNGSGKTTLLKIMMGELTPDSGEVLTGDGLERVYFDQQRNQLRLDRTVRENIGEGSDFVSVNGRSRHVVGYLKEFLFPPERIDTPVSALSGGEKNRLLLARILARPASLMVLDEPTNDLDIETLELLEELLTEYQGTLVLVSHDRAFLDNVVSSTLAFEGDGVVNEYVGGYSDWLRQRPPPAAESPARAKRIEPARPAPPVKRTKLSYKLQLELDSLPGRIDGLEREQDTLRAQVMQPGFYKQDRSGITGVLERMESVERQLEDAYRRWEELDRQLETAQDG